MNPRLTRCLALCALALAVCIGIGAALVLSKNQQREAEAAAAAASQAAVSEAAAKAAEEEAARAASEAASAAEAERLAAEAAAAKRQEQVDAAQAAHDTVAYGDKLGRIWVEGTKVDCALYWGDSESQFSRGAGCRERLRAARRERHCSDRCAYRYLLFRPRFRSAWGNDPSGNRLG